MLFNEITVIPSATQEYDQSIFIWLDILGFSDAVEDETRYKDLYSRLKVFQNLFVEGNGYEAIIISDGIILEVNSVRYDKLKDIFQYIGQRQMEFICKEGCFIRGGIAVGTRYTRTADGNNIFISNGLARAVKIEGKHVDWPIIGTNQKNLEEMRAIFNIHDADENFGLCNCFNSLGEKVYFIDFIKNRALNALEEYINILKSRLSDNSITGRIKLKYLWLLRHYYHHHQERDIISNLVGHII